MKTVIKKIFWCFNNFNETNWLYKSVSLIGLVIRVLFLPNLMPNIFETVAEFFVGQLCVPLWAYHLLIRLALFLIDSLGLLHIFWLISYTTVGNSYARGSDCWWWGSLCYSIYYSLYWIVPVLLFQYFYWWVIATTFTVYALISVGIYILSGFLDTLPDKLILILRAVIHFLIFAIVLILVCLFKGEII